MPNGFKTLNLVKQRLADKTPVVFDHAPVSPGGMPKDVMVR